MHSPNSQRAATHDLSDRTHRHKYIYINACNQQSASARFASARQDVVYSYVCVCGQLEGSPERHRYILFIYMYTHKFDSKPSAESATIVVHAARKYYTNAFGACNAPRTLRQIVSHPSIYMYTQKGIYDSHSP